MPDVSLYAAAIALSLGVVAAYGWHRWATFRDAYRTGFEQLAEARAADFQVLARFSDGLASVGDIDRLKGWLATELPLVVGDHPHWVAAWMNEWVLLAGEASEPGSAIPRSFIAGPESWHTFPLMAGDHPVGVMAVRRPPEGLPHETERLLVIVASLVATALQNMQMLNRARALSMTDALTGCLTRQFGIDALTREMRRMRRAQTMLCVAMLDLDHFKRLNDTLGHPAGDRVLAMAGRALREGLRASDVASRYGGDEFLIILPDTSLTGALRAIENIRRRIRRLPSELGMTTVELGASAGLTAIGTNEDDAGVVVERADAALYEAKRSGRDTVSAYPAAQPIARSAADAQSPIL